MIDITKDEFWNSKYEETQQKTEKKSRIKENIVNNKLITIFLIGFGICTIANIVLIYNFFKILGTL